MTERTAVLTQYLIPKQALTLLAGRIARTRAGALTTRLIAWFVQRYRVNMAEAANPDVARRSSRPRVTITAARRWWGVMSPWQRSLKMATLPRCT